MRTVTDRPPLATRSRAAVYLVVCVCCWPEAVIRVCVGGLALRGGVLLEPVPSPEDLQVSAEASLLSVRSGAAAVGAGSC